MTGAGIPIDREPIDLEETHDQWVDRMIAEGHGDASPVSLGEYRRAFCKQNPGAGCPDQMRRLFLVVARAFKLDPPDLRGGNLTEPLSEAQAVAMYMMHQLGMTDAEIGRRLAHREGSLDPEYVRGQRLRIAREVESDADQAERIDRLWRVWYEGVLR